MKKTVVYKDVTKAKLTLAKDRVEVKIPETLRAREPELLKLAQTIVDSVDVPVCTLRGSYECKPTGEINITMWDGVRRSGGTWRFMPDAQEVEK